jgi:Na+/melibiose symporter-like transporter
MLVGLGMAAVLIAVLLLMSLFSGSGVQWARFLIAVVFAVGFFGFYLWIRFSD